MRCSPPGRTARRRNSIADDHRALKPAAWTVGSSRYSFQDRWLSVRSDRCIAPDGTIIDPFHIVELSPWVNVLAITPEQDVVLVREYRHGTAEITLELPSGTIEAGEAPLATAQRELLEETGYGGGIWRMTASFAANPARQNNLIYTFVALDVAPIRTPRPEAGEVIEIVLMNQQALLSGLADGSINFQSAHMAALFGYFLPALARSASLDAAARALWLARGEAG